MHRNPKLKLLVQEQKLEGGGGGRKVSHASSMAFLKTIHQNYYAVINVINVINTMYHSFITLIPARRGLLFGRRVWWMVPSGRYSTKASFDIWLQGMMFLIGFLPQVQ